MVPAGFRKIPYLRKVFLVTHLAGLVAGAIFPFGAVLLIGDQALRPAFFASCLVMGLVIGASLFLFVRVTLKDQLRRQLELLRPLAGEQQKGGETVEVLNQAVVRSVRQVEDFVRTLLATIDAFVPHYRALAASSSYLSERARDGLQAATTTRRDVEAVEAKQREIAEQMRLLGERTQDEAALSRELSASLEEMAGAMEHSNTKFLETTTSVDEMASSIQEAGAQADKISLNIEGTVHDLDAIGEAFARIRSEARASAGTTATVQQDAGQGLEVVQQSMEEMTRIEAESGKATEAMERLARQTKEVVKIIEVIRELVSDSELLAFNAAIIAAQAGEEGRGFSVVAEEIRDLADRTTGSAEDIQRIVKAIHGDTHEVTDAIAATGRRIARGQELSRATGEALQKIVAGVHQAAAASTEIVELTGDQEVRAKERLDGAGQILRSVKAIARTAQEQQVATQRIQEGVTQMQAAADQVTRGMDEQVRANRGFDQGLASREGQIQAVDEAIRFQAAIAERVFAHFASSEQRLRSNAERAGTITAEIAEMEVLTARLRELAQQFENQTAAAP